MKKRGFGDALNMDSLYSMYSSEKRRSQYGGLTEEKRTPCILGAFVRERVVTRGLHRIAIDLLASHRPYELRGRFVWLRHPRSLYAML